MLFQLFDENAWKLVLAGNWLYSAYPRCSWPLYEVSYVYCKYIRTVDLLPRIQWASSEYIENPPTVSVKRIFISEKKKTKQMQTGSAIDSRNWMNCLKYEPNINRIRYRSGKEWKWAWLVENPEAYRTKWDIIRSVRLNSQHLHAHTHIECSYHSH